MYISFFAGLTLVQFLNIKLLLHEKTVDYDNTDKVSQEWQNLKTQPTIKTQYTVSFRTGALLNGEIYTRQTKLVPPH